MSDSNSSLGQYLRARRDVLRPEDVGLVADAGRRVSGLRRQEVATMAGISPDYYLRLEQGRDHQPSPQVLLALGRALQLDGDATAYLFRLAGQALPLSRGRGGTLRPGDRPDPVDAETMDNVTTFLNQWTNAPAYVLDRNQDVLAVNPLGRSFIPFGLPPGANMLEAMVEGALAATERQEYWDRVVRDTTAALRYYGDPADPRLERLVETLSQRSEVVRDTWASHEAKPKRGGVAPALIEPFGYINFRWQTLEVPGGGQYLTTFFGDPGSTAAAAIEYLAAKLKVSDELAKAGPDLPPPLGSITETDG
ncbi:XRE family transcriptional regulator [Humibacter sp. BT305]|uniref:helix-turn-helix transcriptional regulator n=1 Tax=Cnuibacter physcomitrellae TaxID=1619308 RepID=UPI000E0AE3C8|nr:helix-turn-helix transcriptional regulator [Cnuibacter physcomitrellae]AXH34592.1 XRE family transcriptional regulator [Humibacter sp. BT305]MCS5497712.1 helix-turn-helix transcriptional regulator [Cnuibacter physcomitrellae]